MVPNGQAQVADPRACRDAGAVSSACRAVAHAVSRGEVLNCSGSNGRVHRRGVHPQARERHGVCVPGTLAAHSGHQCGVGGALHLGGCAAASSDSNGRAHRLCPPRRARASEHIL
eukprot:Amastigsp_a184346_31.p3 type:complete len:115 gc:universal Amastigsp_a184346_31:923-579(-)